MINKAEYYLLTHGELNQLVRSHFPQHSQWDFVSQYSTENGAHHLYEVDKRGGFWTADGQFRPYSDNEDVTALIGGKRSPYPWASTMLKALCVKEVIPEGNYLIEVSW